MDDRNDAEETKEFFQALGEIWRDITAIEFLMRCALAQKLSDVEAFPKPPYDKGRIYKTYPSSFSINYFGDLAEKFNREFPSLALPSELIELRDAIAHGIIAEINSSGVPALVKFRRQRDASLKVEFSLPLEMQTLRQLRQSIGEYRRYVMDEASDKI